MSKGGRYVHRPGHHKANDMGMVNVLDLGEEAPQDQGRSGSNFMVDRFYEGARSPIDGSDIGSRAKRREHMRAHGLVDADDYKGQWAQQAKQREEFLRTGKEPGVDWGKRLAETHEQLSRRR
jgi:hypothetical protein